VPPKNSSTRQRSLWIAACAGRCCPAIQSAGYLSTKIYTDPRLPIKRELPNLANCIFGKGMRASLFRQPGPEWL
jgi:hypothetical protein